MIAVPEHSNCGPVFGEGPRHRLTLLASRMLKKAVVGGLFNEYVSPVGPGLRYQGRPCLARRRPHFLRGTG